MRVLLFSLLTLPLAADTLSDLRAARDKQDRDALAKSITTLSASAEKANTHQAWFNLALANSYLAEVSQELRLKNEAKSAAEAGIRAADKAIALKPDSSEYHRIRGTLCGQIIPANVLAGLKYGRCALDSVNKALELDPKSSTAFLARGVGNYYLPPSFGGGIELAIKDIRKAVELNPKFADAYVWLGLAYRKNNANAEARKAFQQALQLNPARLWAKQQLEKTPQ